MSPMSDPWLKRRREQLDLSQHDVALALGYTANTVGQWERLQNPPPVHRAADMAVVYKCTTKRIIEAIAEIVDMMKASQDAVLSQ